MKKKLTFILSALLLLSLCAAFLPSIFASSTDKSDGLYVKVESDRDSYSGGDTVMLTVTLKNTNSAAMSDIKVKTLIPEGLSAADEASLSADVALEPGEERILTVKATADKGSGLLLWILCGGGALVAAGAVTVVVCVLRKNKKGKNNSGGGTDGGGEGEASEGSSRVEHAGTALSLILCASMLIGSVGCIPAKADTSGGSDMAKSTIRVNKSFNVDGEPVTVNVNVSYKRQTVPADIAALFGVSAGDFDTDGDGLSNYIEIYITGTYPTLTDSDGDGVADGDEDCDLDGLTNLAEIQAGTSLVKADTDGDRLKDIRELDETHTNPCAYDTDGDTLSDGDEIALGLDPTKVMSDGVTLDSERRFTQTLSAENIDGSLTAEGFGAVPSLTLSTTGNINSRVFIDKTSSNDFGDSRAVLGEAVEIYGDKLGEGSISFTLPSSAMFSARESSSVGTSIICRYDDEKKTTQYLDTKRDAAASTLSADITEGGTYFVLDVKNLFDELGIPMPKIDSAVDTVSEDPQRYLAPIYSEAAELPIYAAAETEEPSAKPGSAMAQADIVFLIDTTGSMSDEINNTKNNVTAFVDALNERGITAALALIDYQDITVDGYDSTVVHKNGTSNWYYDTDTFKSAIESLYVGNGGDTPECAVDALETGRLLDMRPSAGKIFILITDADYKVNNRYGVSSMAEEIELLSNSGVVCAVISPSSEKSTYAPLVEGTGGIWANIYGDFYTELMTLADKIGTEIVGDGHWIYLDGPVPIPVRLDEELYEGSEVDTDGDGIRDIDELEGLEPTGSINLTDLLALIYSGVSLEEYGEVKMYKYKSNPAAVDTDFDGTNDKEDPSPRYNLFEAEVYYNNGGTKHYKAEFEMDYRQILDNGSVYNRDLATLALMYAADIYSDGKYVKITDGARTGGGDDDVSFGKLLGLSDTVRIEISKKEYKTDKDDITDVFVGHRKIEYNGKSREIIIVSVRGTNGTNEEWSSNFDVGADTSDYYNAIGETEWKNKEHHKGFDVTAERVLDELREYFAEHLDASSQKNILITGHSRGAGIANLLGKYFEDDSSFNSHTYTFAAPNTTTSASASSYSTIYNIVNKDDLVPFLPHEGWGFTKYGTTKQISIDKEYETITKKEGSWKWLMGEGYNSDGGTQRTLDAILAVASTREELYILDSSDDGKVWENNIGHTTTDGAQKELEELTETLKNEKLYRFCKLSIVGTAVKHVEVNYCPAYLMQSLANMTTKVGPALGHDVKGVYASAKASFVFSSGKLVVGGMEHPHLTGAYYLIVYNNFKKLG